jgi:hypothetical protein
MRCILDLWSPAGNENEKSRAKLQSHEKNLHMVQKQLQEFHHRPNLPFPCIKEKTDQDKEKSSRRG